MAEFYVDKTASDEKGHRVHDKDCEAVSTSKEFMYLGSYASAQAAFNKAKGYYDPVTYCPNCLQQ